MTEQEPRRTPEPSGVDLARVALRAAREQARARGDAAQQKKQVRRGAGLRSGARADGRDPMALGAAINRLLNERGWEAPAAVGGVMGRWPEIVGEDVAKHCVPERYDEDERVLARALRLHGLGDESAAAGADPGRPAQRGPRTRSGQTDQGAGSRRPRAPLRPAARPRIDRSGRHLRVICVT
ncbi:DciA family protein [Streptomyces sp. SS7]|uniref:DciA family protein n=1 Tax=Streptomyces sp. SS7 TaxID=3108485 RepID=UPI0030EE12ED